MLVFQMIEVALVNSYILAQKCNQKYTKLEFRRDLILQLATTEIGLFREKNCKLQRCTKGLNCISV